MVQEAAGKRIREAPRRNRCAMLSYGDGGEAKKAMRDGVDARLAVTPRFGAGRLPHGRAVMAEREACEPSGSPLFSLSIARLEEAQLSGVVSMLIWPLAHKTYPPSPLSSIVFAATWLLHRQQHGSRFVPVFTLDTIGGKDVAKQQS